MKNILIILFLLMSISGYARVRYVTPRGNDVNTGADSSSTGAWATWGKAFRTAVAGDTIYFRGGVYYVTSATDYGAIANSGTSESPICFFAYPNDFADGNHPILDFSRYLCGAWTYAIRTNRDNHLKFNGLTIRNMAQYGGYLNAFFIENSDDISIENCTAHHIGGPAFNLQATTNVYVRNCDAWEVCDTLNSNGAGMDGNGFAGSAYYYGCRAWNCSDWGFVVAGNEYSEYVNCWSFSNGRFYGEGGGIKYSMGTRTDTTVALARTIRNCIFAINAFMGGEPNNVGGTPFNGHYYNNFMYHNGYKELLDPDILGPFNGTGWWICSPASAYYNYYPPNELFANNISYDNDNNKQLYNQGYYTHEYNSWDYPGGITISDDDFISLDTLQLWYPRKADGSLPEITFGKLAQGSDLIDAGIPYIKTRDYNIKLTFDGSAPDLGWFESSGTSSTPTQEIPVYISSVIQNAAPARLEMNFNLTLANIVPATSAFTVKVNNVTRSVSTVGISATKVLLTLASPVVYGDAVTVAYTKPASNPLQTAAGGQAVSITAQNVTNNVGAINPVYVSSAIENATPSKLEMTYNLTLANIIPAASAFTVKVNTVTRTVSSVAVSGTKVLLTLASPVISGDAVTVAYTKPASNPLQTAAGGQAVSITAQNVTNNVAVVNQPPVVSISSPTKSTSFVTPATITIDANASDSDGSVTQVEFYSGTSKLGEITTIPYSYTWKEVPAGTYSITAAATDNKGLRTVSAAVTVVVEKSATAVNQLPTVSIKIPNEKKPKKHDTVVIIAEASDPDGTISKVELKNGNVKIAEMTTAPYVFSIQNVDTGTYLITATAIDNLGAVSMSEAIELKVEDYYNPDLITLYPNPNNGFFKIDIVEELPDKECWLSIINLTGTIVYQDIVTPEETFKEIRLPDLQSGPYVLMLTNGKTILTTKKFIKQ